MSYNYIKNLLFFFLLSFIASEINAKDYMQELWKENLPLYQKIFNMPFNKALLNGTLNEEIFKNYIIQDYFFLQNYRRVYGILLSKATDENGTKFVAELIKGIDEEINDIHTVYFKKFNITKEDLKKSTPYPSTEFYNSFLVKTAIIEPFEVGLISTLPCNWIYYQLGNDMKNSKHEENNKYQEWIDGYGSISWDKSDTKMFVDLINLYMNETTAENRNRMKQAFKTAMKLEYMFWDGVYNKVDWIN